MVTGTANHNKDLRLLAAGCLPGIVIAAFLAAGKPYYWANVAYFWLPHAAFLGLIWLFRAPLPFVGGAGLALALYLTAFGWWVFSRDHPDSMVWIGYLLSLPGGAFTAIIAMCWTFISPKSALITFLIGLGAVSLGIALNQAALCKTAMYCGGS